MNRSSHLSTRDEMVSVAFSIFLWTLALAGPVAAGIQDDLNDRWQGRWVILTEEVASNCDGSYTNNQVRGSWVESDAAVRFPAGELARVEKVDVKRGRVDLLLDLHEPVLLGFEDGPFELFREARCQVELLIEVPGRAKDQGIEGLESAFRELVERHAGPDEAMASSGWNQRQRRSYPDDYEQTLAEYQAWKVESYNRAVDDRLRDANQLAARLMVGVRRAEESGARYHEEFKNGLVFGMNRMTEALGGDCGELLTSQVGSFARRASAPNRAWADGYEIGQQLAYYVGLAGRLQDCYADEFDPDRASSSVTHSFEPTG